VVALARSPVAAAPTGRRAGYILGGLAVAFLLFDVVGKLLSMEPVLASLPPLGWDPALAPVLGAVQAVGLVLYLVPRTSVLGAVLLTGYLGGAVATHVRVGNPLVSHILFPVYVAILLWAALCLLRPEVRRVLVPFLP